MKKIFVLLILIVLLFGCKKTSGDSNTEIIDNNYSDNSGSDYKVTFIELGSVNCVPCKMMQPVMESIEKKFKDQVNVVFYDVWTQKDAPMAEQYKIRVIPTQVFLDKDGNEYYRHEGFFPEEEVIKVLEIQGVK